MQTTDKRDIARHGHAQKSDNSQTNKEETHRQGLKNQQKEERNSSCPREMRADRSNSLIRCRILTTALQAHPSLQSLHRSSHRQPQRTCATSRTGNPARSGKSKPAVPALRRSNTLPTVHRGDSWTLHPRLHWMYCAVPNPF